MVFSTELDGRVLLFALAASAASALLFGLAPALRSVRPGISAAIKDGDLQPGGRARSLGRGCPPV